jgi:hypothetical protein
MIDMMFPFCGLNASKASCAAAVTSSTKAAEVVLPAFLDLFGPLTRMEA